MKGFSYSMSNFRNHNNELKIVPRPQLNKVVSQDQHKVTQYGMLNRVVMNHLKKKKKKKTNNAPIISFREEFVNEIDHCRSLQKMQSVNSQRNQDIKRHIQQKANMYRQNEELRQMLMNPSLKQHELHSKIYRLESQISTLKTLLEEKDVKHQQQINKLKQKHRQQIESKNNHIQVNYPASNHQNYYTNKQYTLKNNTSSYQKQANHIKAINFSPSKNAVSQNNFNEISSNKYYEADKLIMNNRSYSPQKNIVYQPYQVKQMPQFIQNQLYNPKIITYETKNNDSLTKKQNSSPPKIITYQAKNIDYLPKKQNSSPPKIISTQSNQNNTYKIQNNRQINTISQDNKYNSNNMKTINQQTIPAYKAQIKTQVNQISSQNTKQNYSLGKPVYISSKSQQTGNIMGNQYIQNKLQSSKYSQNTTNQTMNSNKSQINAINYQNNNASNQILTSKRSQGIISYQHKQSIKPSSFNNLQQQKPTINIIQSTRVQNTASTINKSPTYNSSITSVPFKSTYKSGQTTQYKGYGQEDLQEIYKKYCID